MGADPLGTDPLGADPGHPNLKNQMCSADFMGRTKITRGAPSFPTAFSSFCAFEFIRFSIVSCVEIGLVFTGPADSTIAQPMKNRAVVNTSRGLVVAAVGLEGKGGVLGGDGGGVCGEVWLTGAIGDATGARAGETGEAGEAGELNAPFALLPCAFDYGRRSSSYDAQ